MRVKPDMKPWVFTDKSKMSSFRSGTNSASVGALALVYFYAFELNKFCLLLKPRFEERQVMFMAALPILETSAKSVQTTAEVCADYTCSLYRLQLKSPESTTYLQI